MAAQVAAELGMDNKAIFESDSLICINAITDNSVVIPRRLKGLVSQIFALKAARHEWLFQWVGRHANGAPII